jgi:hypothetical protein
VITEYVSLLRDGIVGPVEPEQCRMLDIIGDRADDLNNMVDDMLDVSKLEAGLVGVYRDNCQLATILERVRPSLERKAAVRKARLTIAIEEHLPGACCDADKVGRVIINLAINAIKFCGDLGEVRLWARNDPQSSQLIVGVTDNGPGIEPEHVAAIFKRFKQLEARPLSSAKGFGLGLSIAKKLVDLNLGQLFVESQKDHGSTFSFSVPVAHPGEVMARYLDWLGRSRGGRRVVSLFTASVDESTSRALADGVHAFFHYTLRNHDLLFRTGDRDWLLVVPVDRCEIEHFVARIMRTHRETSRNRPQGALPAIDVTVHCTRAIDDERQALLRDVQALVSSPDLGRCLSV